MKRTQFTRLKVWKHLLPSPTIHTQSQKLPLILLISKTHFVQMFIWGLRVNTIIEKLNLRKALAFGKSTSALLGGQCHCHGWCTDSFTFRSCQLPEKPLAFPGHMVLQFWWGWGRVLYFHNGEQHAGGSAFLFVTTCKGDWKRLPVSTNISPHVLNVPVCHCLYSTGSQCAWGSQAAICCLAASCHPERDVSFVLPEPPIQCWRPHALHPFSPFSEIPLAFRSVLKCLFSESLLFAKWEGMVLRTASIILCYPPPCFQQVGICP